MIVRILLFCVLVFATVVAPTPVFIAIALLYAFRYTAYELLLLAVCIDAYYGVGQILIPYYTITTCVALILIEWMKPRIWLYNEEV
jgi:hypothetical protein